MDWSNDNCPVSNEHVREALPRNADFAEFICETCGRFRITGSAMAEIRHKDRPEREALLAKAKARAEKDGSIPMIDTYL
jgi:hypothetical protein